MKAENADLKSIYSIACLVPGRGGSKGIANKNLALFNGTPLIAVTIELAKRSELFDAIFVSSDDMIILELAKNLGVVPLKRPSEISGDNSTSAEYLQYHYPELSKYGCLMLLQPTSPLRNSFDLEASLELFRTKDLYEEYAVFSVSKNESPIENLVIIDKYGVGEMFLPGEKSNRQDFREMFKLNGAVYLSTLKNLAKANFSFRNMKFFPYIMPPERSIDIDSMLDFKIAQYLAGKGVKN